MWFDLEKSELSFADRAQFHFDNQILIQAPPERVFAALASAESWPHWFVDFVSTTWTSAPPYGVGSTRDVKLKMLTVKERFLAWEPGRRYSFSIEAITLPLVRQMMEDIQLTPASGGATQVRWLVSYTPTTAMRIIHPIARAIFGSMFRRSLSNLSAYLAK